MRAPSSTLPQRRAEGGARAPAPQHPRGAGPPARRARRRAQRPRRPPRRGPPAATASPPCAGPGSSPTAPLPTTRWCEPPGASPGPCPPSPGTRSPPPPPGPPRRELRASASCLGAELDRRGPLHPGLRPRGAGLGLGTNAMGARLVEAVGKRGVHVAVGLMVLSAGPPTRPPHLSDSPGDARLRTISTLVRLSWPP